MSRFNVKKVAVLGAGVMGAQIAAHLANVKVPVILFDLPAKEGPKNGIVTRAVDGLKKLKPSPSGRGRRCGADWPGQLRRASGTAARLRPDHRGDCRAHGLEARSVQKDCAPFMAPHAIVASNTSGLSITKLSEVLPEEIKPRFCGIHFFNPPRYMLLVELINTPTTQPQILDDLETFVTSSLGKGVVRAKDTPNFIANRIGVAGMLSTMKEVENFGLSYDVVDDLTGKKLGRASSGTFRTADVVGLDTMAHVIKTLQDTLSGDAAAGVGKFDPFYASFATPEVLKTLLEMGHLGQKSKAGFFKKAGRDILRFDLASKEYVPCRSKGR
jgi:3-hydroxyacyl-CoA dehydrogenase